ncbi:putative MIND kinetochore complex component Mtw1 [Lineolata rhizophorae]|uniref:Putative MIND kinetochore complex component Mtw1 n=1 Tax=Lineolata rhizophorae TaxID=578093 RepID=A0A6A6PE07_9PEZI|nr:putative MIND kinetochore complex component Mtw1 [Lineolata rhizophorae]
MSNPKAIETSLLTEHLRYNPISLIDDIINLVNELVGRAVDAAEEGLLDADPVALGFAAKAAAEGRVPEADEEGKPQFPEARTEIENGIHQLETLLESNVDKNFDKLELYLLRNVLTIPEDIVPWVRLPHYENLDLKSATDPNAPTPESLQALRRKLLETQKLHNALLAEKTRNEALLKQLRSLISGPTSTLGHAANGANAQAPGGAEGPTAGAFSFLTETPGAKTLGLAWPTGSDATASANQGPIQTNTAFTISQLPALRSLLAVLRPKLAAMSNRSPGDENETAAERRKYIESQTRRVLARRGVDISGAEGSGALSGRRVVPEEVKALEEIVGQIQHGNEDRMEE